ncbi:DNA damage response protein RcaA [Aspergillus lucknowensis]|uniref:FHA domain-containing protein n=1 Tax=Aspergillus lucknowensis TaxID=176173 RepID=A0ABR4LIH7_9EURO
MWILDSDGDFLDGKRVWLRPGRKYLFGRYKKDGVRHAIPAQSVSRKHLVIEVSPVKAGDSGRINAKRDILISDQQTKYGTIVDGERIQGEAKKLNGKEHTIQLGNYSKSLLRIKWEPTVLTFSFSSNEKAKKALSAFRSRLEDLDIKAIEDYVVDATTHVVQTKRNTAKGLQALVNGKFIVKESFVDALVYAATPSDLDNLESLSLLEIDFDAAWPDAISHLPPPGKEVVSVSEDAFAPNMERMNIFEGYTFVFGDEGQYDLLKPPITNGRGRALYFKVQDCATTAEEIVEFMRNAAGQKGFGSEREGSGRVVLVRFRSKTQEQWSIELGNQVALMTDQRVIEQREFLNAILTNDASVLCRPLPVEMDVEPTSEPPSGPPPVGEDARVVADSQPPEKVSQSSKKGKSTRPRKYVSKMKTFDDGFDINSIPAYAPEVEDSVESPPPMPLENSSEFQSQHLDSIQEEEDMVSSLLPGASAMKRRRAETSQRSLEESSSRPKSEEVPRPKRQKLDVLEAARQHREAEEDAARERRQQEEELLQSSLRDVDVEKLKGLAIVEEMEMPAKRADYDHHNGRWDERWNGRKNFKKFRRKGDPSQPRRRIQAVIVPLEEVARRGFGIGDHYWVSSHQPSDRGSRENDREHTASQAASEPSQQRSLGQSESERTTTQKSQKRVREARDSDSDDELRFRFRRRR